MTFKQVIFWEVFFWGCAVSLHDLKIRGYSIVLWQCTQKFHLFFEFQQNLHHSFLGFSLIFKLPSRLQ